MPNAVRHASSHKSLGGAAAMKRFVAWLEDHDSKIKPRYHYSGRCMFGATCFGLVGALAEIQIAFIDFVVDNPDTRDVVRQLVQTHPRDQMGRDMIVYFPGVDIPSE